MVDGNILCVDCGGGYTTVYICQNSQNSTLKTGKFYSRYVKLYLNTSDVQKETNLYNHVNYSYKELKKIMH